MSFLTSGMLTLRLVAPSMIYWSVVPLIEIGALAVVCRKNGQKLSFAESIDSFFAGYTPWFVWLTGMAAIWALMSPPSKSLDWTVSVIWLLAGVPVALAWSAYIDFRFFKSSFRRLVVHRAISWSLILLVMGAPTIWSETTGRLW